MKKEHLNLVMKVVNVAVVALCVIFVLMVLFEF